MPRRAPPAPARAPARRCAGAEAARRLPREVPGDGRQVHGGAPERVEVRRPRERAARPRMSMGRLTCPTCRAEACANWARCERLGRELRAWQRIFGEAWNKVAAAHELLYTRPKTYMKAWRAWQRVGCSGASDSGTTTS